MLNKVKSRLLSGKNIISLLMICISIAACQKCYDCECESPIEVGGQVVDTTIVHHEVCGNEDDLKPFEDDGCVCSMK